MRVLSRVGVGDDRRSTAPSTPAAPLIPVLSHADGPNRAASLTRAYARRRAAFAAFRPNWDETDKADTPPLPLAYTRACAHVSLPTLATSATPRKARGTVNLVNFRSAKSLLPRIVLRVGVDDLERAHGADLHRRSAAAGEYPVV